MKRLLSFIPSIIWAVIVAWLSLIPAGNLPEWWFFDLIHIDKWVHISMYFILAVLLIIGVFRFAKAFPSNAAQLWLALIASGYGILMEICQALFTTTRHFEWGDIAADTAGALLGVILAQYAKKKKSVFQQGLTYFWMMLNEFFILNKKRAFLGAILFFIVLLAVKPATAQTEIQDANLAQYYYSQGDFDKAISLYEKLYSKHPDNDDYYTGYYGTLIGLKKYDDAIKVVKKKLKKDPKELTYYIALGNTYRASGDEKSANAQFDLAVKNLYADQAMIAKVAGGFMVINSYERAIATYEKAKKLFNDETMYACELANVYKKNGDITNVIKSYLDLLEANTQNEPLVQNNLQDLIQDNKYGTELQTQLYRRVQKSPANPSFSEMLIWYFVQKKDFDDAFIQVKALDKRNKEEGERVFQFAQSAYSEGAYDAAISGYQYLIDDKGKQSGYYLASKSNLLLAMKTKITVANNYTQQDLKTLETNYASFLSEFGKNQNTLPTIRDQANLEARYLHNLDTAIAILNDALTINTGDRKLNALIKLDLGDYNLMKNEIWDATLLYSQVDKDFKDDELGEEARFLNAKLSYYAGDFEWSQAQMDILKGSTQELISNDAIALSVFITDNMGLDTTPTAMKMYARADLFIYQNRNDEAISTLDSLAKTFPGSPLQDDILFAKARIYLQERKFEDAASMFAQVDSSYSDDLLGDQSTFQLADLYEHQLINKQKAMDLYKSILTKYPGSIYVIESRKRYRDLRGDKLN